MEKETENYNNHTDMPDDNSSSEVILTSFTIGEDEFALDIMKIKEIIKYQKITPIPKAPEFIEGVINLRGLVVPIVDMRMRFGLPSIATHKGLKIIIVQVEDKIIGILVDKVLNILKLPSESVLPPPAVVKGIESEYLLGICESGEKLILLLDLDKIFTINENVVLKGQDLPEEVLGKGLTDVKKSSTTQDTKKED